MTKVNTKTKRQKAISLNPVSSAAFLVSKGFKLVEDNQFENFNMPYYVRESVMLFFNTPVTEWNEKDFYVGYGEMRCGKYYAGAFRWIDKQEQIIEIFKAVTGKELDDVG